MLAVPRLRLFILNDRKYVHSAVLCAPSLRPSLYNTSVILVAPNREHVSVKVIALYTDTRYQVSYHLNTMYYSHNRQHV